jgi:hypothetical protein
MSDYATNQELKLRGRFAIRVVFINFQAVKPTQHPVC